MISMRRYIKEHAGVPISAQPGQKRVTLVARKTYDVAQIIFYYTYTYVYYLYVLVQTTYILYLCCLLFIYIYAE